MGLDRIVKTLLGRGKAADPSRMRLYRPKKAEFAMESVDENGVLVVSLPLEKSGSMLSKAAKNRPELHKTFELDAVGQFLWPLLNGQSTFAQISKRLVQQFKLSPAEAEAGLGAFLTLLQERRLIEMLPPKEGR